MKVILDIRKNEEKGQVLIKIKERNVTHLLLFKVT